MKLHFRMQIYKEKQLFENFQFSSEYYWPNIQILIFSDLENY